MMARDQQLEGGEWTGRRGRIGGWYLNSSLRRLSEMLFLGDCRGAFLGLVSPIVQGKEVILDVGAGSGHYSLALARKLRTGKVISLDLSDDMLRHLERRADQQSLKNRIQVLKAPAIASGLQAESVDLTVSNGLFHELPSPVAVLGEMLRVLKPNGWVIITDFRDTRIGRRIGAAHGAEAHGPFSVGEMEILLTNAGLRNIKVKPLRHWVIGVGQK